MKQTLCQHCQSAPATVYVKQTLNGKTAVLQLCGECAAKAGLGGGFMSFWDSDPFENMLGSFFLPGTSTVSKCCPTCGRSLSEIKQSGRFGCSDCYSSFRNRVELSPFISAEGYKGKRPAVQAKEQTEPTPEEVLCDLKARLKEAVEKEEYEKAAKLRDEIRALNEKEGQ